MSYQDQLTTARRDAYWRALERMRQCERAHEMRALEMQMASPAERGHGHRRDQIVFSAWVLIGSAICGIVFGAALALHVL